MGKAQHAGEGKYKNRPREEAALDFHMKSELAREGRTFADRADVIIDIAL